MAAQVETALLDITTATPQYLSMGKSRVGLRSRLLLAAGGLIASLVAVTWWLLARETRGAEIATVLALPATILGLIVSLIAVRSRPTTPKSPATTPGSVPTASEPQVTAPERMVVGENKSLAIDDVIVKKNREHVRLEVRIRNVGRSTVNVTRATLRILKTVAVAAAVYSPSASYDLIVESDYNEIDVAHVLAPDEVDWFTIRVGFSSSYASCLFNAELSLKYNGENLAVSQPFLLDSAPLS